MKTRRAWLLPLATLLLGAISLEAGFPSFDNLGKALKDVTKTAGDAARVVKGATGLSLEEEIAIGDAVAVEIVSRYGGLWKDGDATRRVNLVGRVLAQFATRQDLEWRFGLLDSKAINAFSAPGGRVFITKALYELAGSDDELAGILAHEIAHIDNRHALKIIARGEMLAGVSELVSDRSSDFAQYEEVVGDVTRELLDKGFDPNTEYDADGAGRELAAITGFAPGGLRSVLEKLERMKSGKTEVFSTHPSAKDRLKRLPADTPAKTAELAVPAHPASS